MMVLLQAQTMACWATLCLLHGISSRLKHSRIITLTSMTSPYQALGVDPLEQIFWHLMSASIKEQKNRLNVSANGEIARFSTIRGTLLNSLTPFLISSTLAKLSPSWLIRSIATTPVFCLQTGNHFIILKSAKILSIKKVRSWTAVQDFQTGKLAPLLSILAAKKGQPSK